MKDEQGDQDVDVVLTTREIVRMLRGANRSIPRCCQKHPLTVRWGPAPARP